MMGALLLRHLVESTLLCMLLGAVACSLRRQGAAARHTLWLIGVSKFLIPASLFTAVGAQLAFVLPATAWISLLAAQASALLVSLFGNWPAHILTGHVTAIFRALLTAWLLGSLILFAAWLIRFKESRHGLLPTGRREREALDRAQQMLGSAVAAGIRFSGRWKEPALAGIFRPTITIPRGLPERLAAPEFEAVLLHELAHARRRDNLSGAFVHGVVCIFWFHPLLWFAERRLLAERERACDEAVIQCGVAPRIYLGGLAKVCRFHLFPDVAGISAVNGSDLATRFDRIQAYRSSAPVPYVVRFLLGGVAVFLTVLPMAGGYCEQCGTNLQDTARQVQVK
jgi:bla regulator protein blaR1